MTSSLNPIRQHPEYPFGDTAEPRIARWLGGFLNLPEPDTREGDLLRSFLERVDRFSFLERLVQGDVRYELPLHSRAALQAYQEDPEEAGESMAAAELQLHKAPEQPALDLADNLEEMGIKLFYLERAPLDADLVGALIYEGTTGPAVLVGATRDSLAAPYVVAHALGHLIVDVDPHRPRFCRWDPRTLINRLETIDEIRADRFARAILLPPEQVGRTLDQIASDPSAEHANRIELIETLYQVPAPVARRRLIELGFASVEDEIEARSRCGRSGSEPDPGGGGRSLTLPDRFINLALALYVERLMEQDLVARFLGVSEAEMQDVIEWPPRKPRPES